MTNTNPHPDQSLTESFTLISRNICIQLVALQKAINARDEGHRHPTPQDIAMQHKLIGCLDKLRRLSGEKVSAKNNRTNLPKKDDERQPSMDQPQNVTESSPITEHDFKDYNHLLYTLHSLRDTDTIRFRGRLVNTKWLQYNLLQYCLPPAERKFIGDARRVIAEVNYNETQEKAKQLMQIKSAA